MQERRRVLALVRRGTVLHVRLPQGVDRPELHRKGNATQSFPIMFHLETLTKLFEQVEAYQILSLIITIYHNGIGSLCISVGVLYPTCMDLPVLPVSTLCYLA